MSRHATAGWRVYVMIYHPQPKHGSPPVGLIGPFSDYDAASDWGAAWQARAGDNPCWHTIEFEGDPIARLVIDVERP